MSQMAYASSLRRKPRTYVDQINAQRAYLPQLMQQKAQRQALADQKAIAEKEYGLKEREIGLAELNYGLQQQEVAEAARANAANEAHNAASLDLQNRTLQYEKDAAKKTFGSEMFKLAAGVATSPTWGKSAGAETAVEGGKTGLFGGLGDWGNTLRHVGTGALAGFGVSKMLQGKKKNRWKGAGLGLGAGLLTGFLGNGGFGKNTWSSGVGGALGGLFG